MDYFVFDKAGRDTAMTLDPILKNLNVRRMRLFNQHGDTSCYSHSLRVARYSYKVCRFFGLDCESVVRGSVLHDFFLYNWRDRDMTAGEHLVSHPHAALEMAQKEFELNDMEQDIILTHMWPVTKQRPAYAESHIVSIMDKVSATVEAVSFSFRVMKRFQYKYFDYVRVCLRRMPIRSGLY